MSTRPNITLDIPTTTPADAKAAHVLPIGANQRNERQLVSDATILRLSTALQASLYIKDVIHAFANEIRRIVRVASVTYRNAERQETIEDGSIGQHRCNYEISLLGDSLGEITFTRNKFFSERE